MTVQVPYFRTDIEQEDDVIEEVLRLYGYDKIPEQLPPVAPPTSLQSKAYTTEEKVRDILVAVGLDEQITEPLTLEENPLLAPVVLQNSLNSEKTMLRTTLQHSLVSVLKNRVRYRQVEPAVFEIGKIYFQENDTNVEKRVVGMAVILKENGYSKIKGIVEILFARLGYEYQPALVTIVQMRADLYFAELQLEKLLELPAQLPAKVLTTPPQVLFQDFSFQVAQEVQVGEVLAALHHVSDLVTKVSLGESPRIITETHKSLFVKVTFSSEQRTLSAEEIEPLRLEMIQVLQEKFNAHFAS